MPILNLSHVRSAHDKFLAAHAAMVSGVLYDAGVIAQAEVAIHPGFTPHTGKLQRATKSRTVRIAGGRLLRISNDAPYAKPVEEGSRPHVIRARNAKALRFYTSGGVVFRRSVNHPGTKPYWFLKRASGVAGERVHQMLEQRMKRVADNFGA